MKKLNLLFNNLFIVFTLIVCIGFLINSWNFSDYKPITHKEKEEIIVYDTKADWSTVEGPQLKKQSLKQNLDDHFTDIKTNSCFFLIMKMLGVNVNIKKYYLDFFNETKTKTYHQGKVSPDLIYQNSLVYIANNDIDLSVQDISNKSKDYLFSVIKNNYPVLIWYKGEHWTTADPYIIYGIDNDCIYMYNYISEIKVTKEDFLNNYTGQAIVYGKYW